MAKKRLFFQTQDIAYVKACLEEFQQAQRVQDTFRAQSVAFVFFLHTIQFTAVI